MSFSDPTSSASKSGDPVKAIEIAKVSFFRLKIDGIRRPNKSLVLYDTQGNEIINMQH